MHVGLFYIPSIVIVSKIGFLGRLRKRSTFEKTQASKKEIKMFVINFMKSCPPAFEVKVLTSAMP